MEGERPAKKSKLELNERRLIVILENASLEAAKIDNKRYELLASDKHMNFLRKNKKDPGDYRPDITHQCLLMLLDSPLNREGLLQIFIHTDKNVLIEVSPQVRIPRTYDRFAGLMVELLHKLAIRAADSPQKLLKVVKNPVSNHLPVGCRKIGTSFQCDNLTKIEDLVPQKEDGAIAIVIGALARGKVKCNYTEEEVKLSNYPLSAALTCAKLCHVFESQWGVL